MGFGLERTISYTEIRWTWSLQGKEQAGLLDSEEYPGFLGILPRFVWPKQRFDVLCESGYLLQHHAPQPPHKICYLVPICQEGAMGHLRINLNFDRKRSMEINEWTFFIANLCTFHIFAQTKVSFLHVKWKIKP